MFLVIFVPECLCEPLKNVFLVFSQRQEGSPGCSQCGKKIFLSSSPEQQVLSADSNFPIQLRGRTHCTYSERHINERLAISCKCLRTCWGAVAWGGGTWGRKKIRCCRFQVSLAFFSGKLTFLTHPLSSPVKHTTPNSPSSPI